MAWMKKKVLFFWCCYTFLCVQARYFFQQLISGVSYCHSMVKVTFRYQKDALSDLTVKSSHSSYFFPLLGSKYAIEIWSWKTLCWMEALHHAWRYVILVTLRFDCISRLYHKFCLVWWSLYEIFILWCSVFV